MHSSVFCGCLQVLYLGLWAVPFGECYVGMQSGVSASAVVLRFIPETSSQHNMQAYCCSASTAKLLREPYMSDGEGGSHE
jgi:serine acetyltransferase